MPGFSTITRLLGIGFVLQGVAWLVAPAPTAASLGMTLLDGLGRSTQVGDFAAFFLTGGVGMLAGARPGQARLLWFPAFLFAAAAFGRTVAWALHGAAFAGFFIGVELAMAALLAAQAGAPSLTERPRS